MTSDPGSTPIAPPTHRPALPKTFTYSNPPPTLHYQGAEALLYRTSFLSSPDTARSTVTSASAQSRACPTIPAALKHRPAKPYRHPLLDAKLTRHRILSEARVLAKLRRDGVNVPALYALDWEDGWMMMEWIDGGSVRAVLDARLGEWLQRQESIDSTAGSAQGEGSLWGLMGMIGAAAGRMHEVGVVHGDLTTSNILLRPNFKSTQEQTQDWANDSLEGDVVLIDFGLAEQSTSTEDRAVDLYVLERAFGSTHPRTEGLFREVLRAYGESYKSAKITLKKLEEVRMRGRKKIMIG